MLIRAAAILSVVLQVTVSLPGHFGLHAMLGESHCPAMVRHRRGHLVPHGDVVATVPAEQPETGHGHTRCRRGRTGVRSGTVSLADDAGLTDDGSAPSHGDRDGPVEPGHSPHRGGFCGICSVLAQAQTVPAETAGPALIASPAVPLPELDIAPVELLSTCYESRGPPGC